MPNVVTQVSASINQDASHNYGTGVAPTCFGLPGSGTQKASYCTVHLNITCKAMDNGHLYLDCNGSITQKVVANSGYTYTFGCRNADWAWGGNPLTPPSGYYHIQDGSVDVVADGTPGYRGQFQVDINKVNVDLGPLSDWGASITGQDGIIWFSGTGTYTVKDPIYPDPIAITVPGFVQLFDYFPFAVRKGGVWKSCNRSGGGSYIRKGGSWRDLKNSNGTGESDAYYRSGGSWIKTPKIGELS